MEENLNNLPPNTTGPANLSSPSDNQNSIPKDAEMVDIDLKKKPPEEKTVLTFADFNVEEHVAQKTESEILNKQNAEMKGQVTQETKRTVAGEIQKLTEEEKKYTEQFTVEDFEDLAGGIIDAFDILMGWALWRFSLADPKKSSTSEYKVPEEKLKRLKTILAKILMKMNMKFPLWGTLAMVAVFTYLPAATKANAIRKENVKKREEEELAKKNKKNPKALGPGSNDGSELATKIIRNTKSGPVEVTVPVVQKEFIPEKKSVVINDPPPPPPPPPPVVRRTVTPAKIEVPRKNVPVGDEHEQMTPAINTAPPPPPPPVQQNTQPVVKRVPRTGVKSGRGGKHKA